MSRCIQSYVDVITMEQPTLWEVIQKIVTQIFGSIK
jgi:hypothetical protein